MTAFCICYCCCWVTLVVSDSVRPHRRQATRLPRPWDSPGKNTGVDCHFLLQCMKVKNESEVIQLCLTLSDTMDCSPPGSSIHGIFQARVLEWGAIAFSDIVYKFQHFSNVSPDLRETMLEMYWWIFQNILGINYTNLKLTLQKIQREHIYQPFN